MDKARALHSFWSSFSWKAYDANTVPSEDQNPEMPRITYEVATSEFDAPIMLSASLWDKGYSWASVSQKAEEIYNYIGLGGRVLQYDGGHMWIKRGTPFSQRMSDENDAVRRVMLTVEIEFFAL